MIVNELQIINKVSLLKSSKLNISQRKFSVSIMIGLKTQLKSMGRLMLSSWFSRSQAKKNRDLYQILGVSKSADATQIKKAYYKLAQQHHPDKNPGPDSKDKFAEINNAYQILSDTSKRQIYDQTGSTDSDQFQDFNKQGFSQHFRGGFGQNGGINLEDIFADIFGKQRSQPEDMRENINVNIDLTFAQSVNGVEKTIQYSKKQVCSSCKGSKAEPGTKPQKCTACQGRGVVTMKQGPFIMESTCNSCEGVGQKIKKYCKPCSGSGVVLKTTQQQINFPKGVDNGTILRFRGKGHLNGDLTVNVKVKKHPRIRRQANDAHSQIQISVVDAVLGTSIQIETIYGQKKPIFISQGTQSGDKIKINKQGFYVINSSEKGNHVVTVKVKIPKNTTEQQKILYEKLKSLQQNAK